MTIACIAVLQVGSSASHLKQWILGIAFSFEQSNDCNLKLSLVQMQIRDAQQSGVADAQQNVHYCYSSIHL